jgi:hypothetical protein
MAKDYNSSRWLAVPDVRCPLGAPNTQANTIEIIRIFEFEPTMLYHSLYLNLYPIFASPVMLAVKYRRHIRSELLILNPQENLCCSQKSLSRQVSLSIGTVDARA